MDKSQFLALFKHKVVLGLIGLAIVLAAVWQAANVFQSPAQRAANAEPPKPLPIVVPVTKMDLRDDFTVKAKQNTDSTLTYPLPSPEGERAVVTAGLKRPGDTVFPGLPVVEINDRPILTFFGNVPMYRTITGGARGSDVQRLQLALAQLGYNIEADGVFGPRSQAALRKHFKSVGYSVPTCDVEVVDPKNKEEKKTVALPCLRLADAIFIPVDKPRVISAPTTGQILAGDNAKLVISGGGSGLIAEIPYSEIEELKVGDEASAYFNGKDVPITVIAITDKKESGKEGEEEQRASSANVTFAPVEAGLFNNLGDQELLLTVPRQKPITDALVVPQRAIAQGPNGQASVLVQQEKEFVAVPVEEHGCVAGQCAVSTTTGQLREGMMVRVDQE